MTGRWPARALLAAGLLAPSMARGQSTGDAAAQAEQLFRDGRAQLAAKDYSNACPNLARSQRLDPATGTLLALAMCHEAQGLTATAWEEFRRALPAARQENRNDRVELATTHLARLDPKVARVVIRVSAEARGLAGLQVTRDGEPVDVTRGDVTAPVDPGSHTVVATATGHEAWQGRVTVEDEGKHYEILVPPLAESMRRPIDTVLPSAPASEDEAPRVEPGIPTQRWIAYGLFGVGAASVVVGSVFGVRAISDSSQAKSLCNGTQCADPHALELNDQARSSATVSNVTFGLGAVALGAGAVLWFLTPDGAAASVRATASRSGAFVGYGGAF